MEAERKNDLSTVLGKELARTVRSPCGNAHFITNQKLVVWRSWCYDSFVGRSSPQGWTVLIGRATP